jgi:hypothetical protein
VKIFVAQRRHAITNQNPKSEYPNPKQTGSPINPKLEKFSNPEADLGLFRIFRCFDHLNLFRISDFELRIFFHFLAHFASLRESKKVGVVIDC